MTLQTIPSFSVDKAMKIFKDDIISQEKRNSTIILITTFNAE